MAADLMIEMMINVVMVNRFSCGAGTLCREPLVLKA